jgi:hypothetical protein
MVVRGRGTPAGRDETPHSTGSLLAPSSRPERTRHPGTVVAFRIPYDVWARGGRSGGADRTAGGSGGPNARTRADCAGLHGRLNQTRKLRIGFGIEIGDVGIARIALPRLALVARRHGESGRTH